jgi:hypothetical protein
MTQTNNNTKHISSTALAIVKTGATKQQLYDKIWEITKYSYNEKPVDIDTFIDDERYLGKVFGGGSTYNYWRKLLRKLYPSPYYNEYNEVIMSCAIGVGKTTVTTISMLYELHKLLCLNNPAKFYGLMITDTIVLAIFSSSKDNVNDVNWGKMKDAIAVSPWFQDKLKLDKVEPKVKSLDIAPNLSFQLGSRYQNAIGRDILVAVIDEGNNSIINDQIKTNYMEIDRRRSSRFQSGFMVPGVLWLVSSPKTKDDFLNERIEKSKTDPKVLVVDSVPAWVVKKERGNYCGETFNVFVGDETRDARILNDNEDPAMFPADLIMRPPIEMRSDFEEDLLEAIRDKGGRRVSSVVSLINSVELVNSRFKLPNLFTKDVISLNIYSNYTDILRYVNTDLLKEYLAVPYERHIHFDFASTGDLFGIAATYSKYKETISVGPTAMSRIHSIEQNRVYINEWSVGFKAPDSNGIPTNAILNLIVYLRKMGYNIGKISSDKPGQPMCKELIGLGFEAEYVSVDTSKVPYKTLVSKVYDGTFLAAQNERAVKEFINLRDDGDKIDHPPKFINYSHPLLKDMGGKDIMDAIAGSFIQAVTNEVRMSDAAIIEAYASEVSNSNGYFDDYSQYKSFL